MNFKTTKEILTPVKAAALLARPGEGIEEALERVENTPVKTLKQLAQEAIDIQDASNMLGLSKGFADAVQQVSYYLRQELGDNYSTDRVNRHPIVQLWTSKLHDLARMGLSDTDRYGEAYEYCRQLAAGVDMPIIVKE